MMTSLVYMEVMVLFLMRPLDSSIHHLHDQCVIVFFSCLATDGFPSVGNATGAVPSGQVLQYESELHYIDAGCKYEGFCDSHVKVDGGVHDPREKLQENNLKTCIAKLQPSGNSDWKNQTPMSPVSFQRKKSRVILLSLKRKSCDGEETFTEYCKFTILSPISFPGHKCYCLM